MSAAQVVVLDTNIVLDLFLFQDSRQEPLRQRLQSGQLQWRATQHMRNELERVLTYAHIAAKLDVYQKTASSILAAFDRHAQLIEEPSAKAPYSCKDPDDQVFINLAASLAASAPASSEPTLLISKDKAVLSMRKRLEKLSIGVTMTILV
jgi:putative PIN family toxin of toxin-antitoxin system